MPDNTIDTTSDNPDVSIPSEPMAALSGGSPAPSSDASPVPPVSDSVTVSADPTPGPTVDSSQPSTTIPEQPMQLAALSGTPVPPKKPSAWEGLVMGAIAGLAGAKGATHFGGGLAGGAAGALSYQQQAKENDMKQQELNQQQQETQARVKFMNAQAASLASDTALHDAQLHALPQQLQDDHNNNALQQLKAMNDMGLMPTLVVQNNKGGQDAIAGLQQITDSHGAVPPLHTINVGHQIIAYDLNQLTQAPQALDQVNKIRAVQGQAPMNPVQWAQTPQAVKNQQVNDALNFWNPLPSEENYTQYKNYLNTLKVGPDSPDKQTNVDRLNKLVTGMRTGLDDMNKRSLSIDFTKKAQDAQIARNLQQSDIDEAAKTIANSPNSLTTLSALASMRGDERLRLYNAVTKMNPNFDPGATDRKVKFLDNYQNPNGRAAINRQAINNMAQHAADLQDLNNTYRRGDVRIINLPLNKIRSQYSSDYTKFQTTNAVLKDELKNYFAGGYAPTKDQEDMWNKIQSDDATPAQTEAFARETLRLASRRASTFNSQFKAAMGYDDPNMITPDALNAAHKMGVSELDRFGSGGTTIRPGSGQQTPTAPAGATMKVPGSDGKLHWSDGKNDLGVAQ